MPHRSLKTKILILDFGSQYTNIIARRIRGLKIYSEIYPFDCSVKKIKDFNPVGIILSGGPESVYERSHYKIAPEIFELNIPILGICYGMQIMAAHFGGQVKPCKNKEFGLATIESVTDSQLLTDIFNNYTHNNKQLKVWMSHGDQITDLPEGFKITAKTKSCPIAAIENKTKKLYGLQFHPEVTHTPQGIEMLKNFAKNICKCDMSWDQKNIIKHLTTDIIEQVGSEEVILGLSGGVDSSVLAALLYKAVGKQLTCIFVDTGLLRLNEGDNVMATFIKHYPDIKIFRVDAKKRFLKALAGISDPENKRKTVGKLFIEVFEEQANNLNKASGIKWLAQGTIYSDIIESAGNKNGKGHVIKSHHNVGGLPLKMNLKVIEPLKELFKDEVRAIGLKLGLPLNMINRHPFPGPGLCVRILGEVREEYVRVISQADDIYMQELTKAGWYHKVSQAFAVFLPIKSVGVMGDGRKYDWVIALRAVKTSDFMTAHWVALPYNLLANISNRIVNEVGGVSRVVYDISGKPPATIEWE